MSVTVTRSGQRLRPDPRRVLAKPYAPGEEIAPAGDTRAVLLLERVLAIPDDEVEAMVAGILADFAARHHDFADLLLRHYALVANRIGATPALGTPRQMLIGAYFTHEYSIEGAALFNPSIVWAPEADGAGADERRFIMSVRAVGEGHISSIGFRTGAATATGDLRFDPPGTLVYGGRRADPVAHDKSIFRGKLAELHAGNEISESVLEQLSHRFTPRELETALAWLEAHGPGHAIHYETAKVMRVLAASSYVTTFPPESAICERVIFPAGPNETHGMEDARFVAFANGDGCPRYYATYTAFDGFQILPQLIETTDFCTFAISTLHGAAAQNKGMALFPRRVGGDYLMLSRKDRENLYLARSGDVRWWNDAVPLRGPQAAWELLQIGNCGSPIETEAGWLVLTHGVGAMRRYCIGALLLDLDDPARVIGALPEPLLAPDASEREGYVPNVLYTCGAIVHAGRLVIPYGYSDGGISVASVSLAELLAGLRASG